MKRPIKEYLGLWVIIALSFWVGWNIYELWEQVNTPYTVLGCDTCADCLEDRESNHYSQLMEEAEERERR
jgi:hypothetical protein